MEDPRNKFQSDVEVCGPFQVSLSVIAATFGFLGGWSMLSGVFLIFNPGWTCVDPTGYNNLSVSAVTTDQPYNGTVAKTDFPLNSSTKGDMCELAKSCPRIVFDSETSTIVTEWSLICDRAWIASMIISIQMVGIVVGTVVTGYFGDRFGRKVTIYTWIGVSAVMNVTAVFSVSWEMFAVVQFVIGLSVGGIMCLGCIYHLEFVESKWRLCLSVFPIWDSGTVLYGIVVFLLKDWRNIHITTAVFGGLILLTVFWVPESLKWLIVHGKRDQAKMVVEKIYKCNRKPLPPSHVMMDFTANEGSEMEKKANVLLLFKRQVIKRTILSFWIMFVHSFMYFAIAFGIQSLFGNFYVNLIIFLSVRIPVAAISPWAANKLGRRLSSLISVILASLISFSIAAVYFIMADSHEDKGKVITILAFASSACVGMSWSVMVTFLSEIFPTTIRSMGYSFALTGARVGAIVAPFCIPRYADLLYIPYLGLGVLAAVCCAMVMSLPETQGQRLEYTMSKGRPQKVDASAKNDVSQHMLS